MRHVPKDKTAKLYEMYINFEKEHGSHEEIDQVVLGERRNIYKDQLAKNIHNYDAWLDLVFLEEATQNIPRIREVYEEALKHQPLA